MIRQVKILAGAVIVSTIGTEAVLADCMQQDERRSEQARYVQTSLMVGAIQCRAKADFRDLYNRFVKLHQTELTESYAAIDRYLKANHKMTIDKYLVGQANYVSVASYKTPDFCEKLYVVAQEASEGGAPADFVGRLPVRYESKAVNCPVVASADSK